MKANLIIVHEENNPSAILDSHFLFEGLKWNWIVTQVNHPSRTNKQHAVSAPGVCGSEADVWDTHNIMRFNIYFSVRGSAFAEYKWP